MYKGIGVSEGIGIGNAVTFYEQKIEIPEKSESDASYEAQRFENAKKKFTEKTQGIIKSAEKTLRKHETDILNGHITVVNDPYILNLISENISKGHSAEYSVNSVFEAMSDMLKASDDPLTAQRASDMEDIKLRLLKILLNIEEHKLSDLPENSVIAAKDLTPSMTMGIDKNRVSGIVTEAGGKTSHSAILSKALGIPAVLGIKNISSLIRDNDKIIVDGTNGEVYLNPDSQELEKYSNLKKAYETRSEELKKYKNMKTKTLDGKTFEIFGNIGTPEEASSVTENGGEGIGLFRTEFLFMERNSPPTEDEQFIAYQRAVTLLKGKPLIIRTLDIGGDKEIPYMKTDKEENPFLGYRAIRYCLNNKEFFKAQLKAIIRAKAYGDIRIMLPLITTPQEVREARCLINEIQADLSVKGNIKNEKISVGVMIETPSACIASDLLAKEVDFFSIGTNDLTQYIMAADRGNFRVEYLYSHFNISVIRAIKTVISNGKKEGIPVGMCGEAACDPLLIPLLLAFGLDEFSVSANHITKLRKTISMWSTEEAIKVADKVMTLSSEAEIRKYLESVKK